MDSRKLSTSSYPHHSGSKSMPSAKSFIGAVEDEWQLYSDRDEDYTVGPPIGFGASSIVYSATFQPKPSSPSTPPPAPIACALKVLDLDALPPRSLSLLQRETNLMSLSKHPNVLRVRGSWMNGHRLFIALRLMNKGSAADVMRYGWPGGIEEEVIICILRQALQGLNYLHVNGFIHRDVKAANLLVDDDGTVLLGDLGVAADLSEDTSRLPSSKISVMAASSSFRQSQTQGTDVGGVPAKRVVLFDHTTSVPDRPKMGKRKSFVGTPCWMAPELIQGRQYDSKADIWSFGITALELSQGRPPRSKDTPQRVLLRTIQDDPPTLDREGGVYKYSRAFKEVIDWCLNKDPSKRPTAEELLQTPLFKSAKRKSYLVGAILKDLPPLALRQERRAINNAHTLHTLDSWDFATTLHSPTASVHRRRFTRDFPGQLGAADDDSEDERFPSEQGRHSRAVSWIGDQRGSKEEPSGSGGDSPRSSDSETSSVLVDSLSGSPSSADKPSPPSSFSHREIKKISAPAPSNKIVHRAIDGPTSAQGQTICGFTPSPTTKAIPIPRPSSRKGSESVSPGHRQSGFWNKLKMNVRRSTSRNDILASESDPTGKGGMGNASTSPSKHVWSRTESFRTGALQR